MILSESDAVYAADKFINYYTQFNRIDDYLRFVKKDRIGDRPGSLFGAESEFFDVFNMHPNDMNFSIVQIQNKTFDTLVVANNDIALINLCEQFSNHTIKRVYEAFIWGSLKPQNGKIIEELLQ